MVGAVYVAVGALGFSVTGNLAFMDDRGDELLGVFRVNPLHNVVHVAIGVALVGAFVAGRRAVVATSWIVGVTLVLVGVAGPFLSRASDVLARNPADDAAHLASGIALLSALLVAAPTRRRTAYGS